MCFSLELNADVVDSYIPVWLFLVSKTLLLHQQAAKYELQAKFMIAELLEMFDHQEPSNPIQRKTDAQSLKWTGSAPQKRQVVLNKHHVIHICELDNFVWQIMSHNMVWLSNVSKCVLLFSQVLMWWTAKFKCECPLYLKPCCFVNSLPNARCRPRPRPPRWTKSLIPPANPSQTKPDSRHRDSRGMLPRRGKVFSQRLCYSDK